MLWDEARMGHDQVRGLLERPPGAGVRQLGEAPRDQPKQEGNADGTEDPSAAQVQRQCLSESSTKRFVGRGNETTKGTKSTNGRTFGEVRALA